MCDPSVTQYAGTPVTDGTGCDDGVACSKDDICTLGACAGTPYDCHDGLPCTADDCAGDGTCVFVQSAASCVIGGACIAAGTSGGVCETCQPAVNPTDWSPAPPVVLCNDGLACTTDDHCHVGGLCAGTAAGCDDGLACTVDACDDTLGCSHLMGVGSCLIDGACTAAGTHMGACRVCEPDLDAGAWTIVSGGCDDGQPCTKGDSCSDGACVGASYACDDDLPCATSSCDGKGGCTPTLVPDGVVCDDASGCTEDDRCHQGSCYGGALAVFGSPCDGPDADGCLDGTIVCSSDESGAVCADDPDDAIETCNGLDDDCDGETDEGSVCGAIGDDLSATDPDETDLGTTGDLGQDHPDLGVSGSEPDQEEPDVITGDSDVGVGADGEVSQGVTPPSPPSDEAGCTRVPRTSSGPGAAWAALAYCGWRCWRRRRSACARPPTAGPCVTSSARPSKAASRSLGPGQN